MKRSSMAFLSSSSLDSSAHRSLEILHELSAFCHKSLEENLLGAMNDRNQASGYFWLSSAKPDIMYRMYRGV